MKSGAFLGGLALSSFRTLTWAAALRSPPANPHHAESSELQTDWPTSTLGSETHMSNRFNEFVKRNYGGMTRDLSNPIHLYCRLGGLPLQVGRHQPQACQRAGRSPLKWGGEGLQNLPGIQGHFLLPSSKPNSGKMVQLH